MAGQWWLKSYHFSSNRESTAPSCSIDSTHDQPRRPSAGRTTQREPSAIACMRGRRRGSRGPAEPPLARPPQQPSFSRQEIFARSATPHHGWATWSRQMEHSEDAAESRQGSAGRRAAWRLQAHWCWHAGDPPARLAWPRARPRFAAETSRNLITQRRCGGFLVYSDRLYQMT